MVIATTNTGIDKFEETGDAEFLKMSNPAEFLKDYLGLEGFSAGYQLHVHRELKYFLLPKNLWKAEFAMP